MFQGIFFLKIQFFFQVRQFPVNACDQTKFNNWNFTSKLFSRIQERGTCSMSIPPTSGRSGGLAARQSNPPSDGAVVYNGIHGTGGGMDRGSIHT
jgi:hypothetical protein